MGGGERERERKKNVYVNKPDQYCLAVTVHISNYLS